ncbi:MAG TPA: tagaturonate epimerase family protein [Rectinemataceae bacterium]|nr:tagaturonate epimerase family protein [Rectinemataceae bacterium]
MALPRFSIGTGDRFGMEGRAQLAALEAARAAGKDVGIVWNKSAREHAIIHSSPADQRTAAAGAVAASGWKAPWFVDADHVGLKTVEAFAPHCDFFTIDVADFIGQKSSPSEIEIFVSRHASLAAAKGLPATVDVEALRRAASRYLEAVKEAGKVYRKIVELKRAAAFVAEVSMDETNEPQSPAELLAILAALADEGIPVSTIAPKFSGRFNKGVDYVGDVAGFLAEFEADVKVTQFAAKAFGLPSDLKLSIHSGSDKFSIYPGIREIALRLNAGFHLKTAGTTWLEELVGLAEAGGTGLAMAKEIYRGSYGRYDELVGPYAAVVDIDRARLPSPSAVDAWDGRAFAAALRHDQSESRYDRGFRQLLHVGYKVAAEAGPRFLHAIEEHRDSVSRNVTTNLLERHLRPLLGF